MVDYLDRHSARKVELISYITDHVKIWACKDLAIIDILGEISVV